MSHKAVGKFKRILKSYAIPISLSLGLIYGVSRLVGSPSEVYREIEVGVEGFYPHPMLLAVPLKTS